MRLKLSRDRVKGAGYAVIEASNTDTSADGLELSISRPGQEQPYLGPGGWQAAGVFVVPESAEEKDGKLLIGLGPEIVQHMAQGNFKVQLKDASGTESKAVSLPWRGIPAYAGPIGGAPKTVAEPSPPPLISAVSPSTEPPQPAPKPQPITTPVPEPSQAQGVQSRPEDEEETKQKGGKGMLIATLLTFLVLAAGGAAFYFLEMKPDTPAEEEAPSVAIEEPAPSVEVCDVDALLTMAPAVDETYQCAQEAIEAGNGADAFRLLQYGANNNHGPSRMLWGNLVDPSIADRPQAEGLPAPSANQAFDLYSLELKNGSTEACGELKRLAEWVEEAAASGDSNARMVQMLMRGIQC